VVAVVFVPQLAKCGLLVWLGEHERSQRAGKYLCAVEIRLSDILGHELLGWETWLGDRRAPTPEAPYLHMRYPYLAVVALLLGVGWVAEAIGVYLIANATGSLASPWEWLLPVLTGVACLWMELWFIGYFKRRWMAVR
jgi:hypothetical protein